MNRKNRIYFILTGVVAITLLWLSQSNRNLEPKLQRPLTSKAADKIINTLNNLEGVLWPSDDETKGNLMLINGYATIYIRTSRDFSNLVGKQVIASVDGTLENFTLLNIEENLAKDGFIQVD